MSTPPQYDAWFNEVIKLISLTFLVKQVERLKKQITNAFRTMSVAFTFNWMSHSPTPDKHRAVSQSPRVWGQPLDDSQSRVRKTDRQFRAQLSDRRQQQLAAVEAANAMTEDRTRRAMDETRAIRELTTTPSPHRGHRFPVTAKNYQGEFFSGIFINTVALFDSGNTISNGVAISHDLCCRLNLQVRPYDVPIKNVNGGECPIVGVVGENV